MYVRVRPLRLRGRRLPWDEVLNGPTYTGDLVTYGTPTRHGIVQAATLLMQDPAAPKGIRDLYEPVLLTMSTLAFRLRGFERQDGPEGPFGVVQEWHCEVPSMSPHATARKSQP